MNRRDFLKSALTIAALASMEKVFSATETGETMNTKTNSTKPQVTRRPYRGTDLTLPLLGFGMMRLPQKDGKVDYALGEKMVAKAMESGCNYFDTAYMYHDGESEKFAGAVLSQYKRDSYFLTDKMPIVMMNTEADNERFFKEQLERTKAGYFDFYFLHWLNEAHWKKAKEIKTLEFMKKMKEEGIIRHIGFSFHGEPETLKEIAESYPWELVQIQLNYLDWELCRSGEQYEVLTKLGIPVSIMEPLKGGTLVKLTPESKKVFDDANPKVGTASWGLRYAASLPNVQVVLSGMSDLAQMEDNIKTFSPMVPLTDEERKVIAQALAVYRKSGAVPCTACRYCSPCPFGVSIPRNLALLNQVKGGLPLFHAKLVYDAMKEKERASACVGCGACKKKCPQQIDIPSFMKQIAADFK